MKTGALLLVLLMGIQLTGCKSTEKTRVPNPKLDLLIKNQAFRIAVDAVQPQLTMALAQLNNSQLVRPGNTLSNINVGGEGYFIKMEGDSVAANLPYYGERQMGGGYGSPVGIVFKEIARDLKIEKTANTNAYQVSFGVPSAEEFYRFMITLENNLDCTAHVTSSHRNRIRFTGKVEELESNEQQ